MKATYNLTTNRFKLYTGDERLTPEQVTEAKKCNFVFYFGQKCWSSIWYPQSEDFIKSLGVEIEEDDTPDNVEDRVSRYEKYADDATKAAEYASERLLKANTERRERLASNSAMNETERALYWNERIAGAISHAEYKDRPDVIARRIKVLEADLRRHERDLQIKGEADGYKLTGNRHWVKPENIPALHENATRWVEHLNRRLDYEKSYLEAVGGIELLAPKERRPRASIPDDGIKKGSLVAVQMPPYYNTTLTGKVVSQGAHKITVLLNRDGREFKHTTLRRICKLVEA
jgi:hypothetical protein